MDSERHEYERSVSADTSSGSRPAVHTGSAYVRIIPALHGQGLLPGDIERRIYERWESSGAFAPRRRRRSRYCIMLPPPNVTGTLHMGHAFQHTLMDMLTRWHRMRGDATLWQPGTDHAGIATQMVVERQLDAEGKHRARSRPRRLHRARVEVEGASPAAPSRARCAASAPRWTGRATSSRWTRTCRARSPRCSCACTKRA